MSTCRSLGLCFVLAAGLYGPASGQADDDPLRFGATGGLAAGSFWNEDPRSGWSYSSRLDGLAGAWLHLRNVSPIELQIGGVLSRQGAHQELIDREADALYFEAFHRLTYVRVPVLARFSVRVPVIDEELQLVGGPHAAILLRAEMETRSGTILHPEPHIKSETNPLSIGEPGYPHRFDVGLTIGAQWPLIQAGPIEWALSTYYSLGLLPAKHSEVVGDDGLETFTLRNHALEVGITMWWLP